MSEITYRDARVDDAEQIVAFYNEVGGETSYLSFEADEYPMTVSEQKDEIRSLEGNKTNRMLLAMDGDEIAGIATIHSSHKIKARQKQGIGSELIRILIDWCKGNGVTTRISLDTRADNIPAVALYMKFGFEIEGCRRNSTLLNGMYYDLYVMGMMIDEA